MNALKNNKLFIIIGVIAIVVLAAWFFLGGYVSSYYVSRATSELNAGNYEAAKHDASSALWYDSKNAIAYYLLGRISLGRADTAGALLYPNADYPGAIANYEKTIALGLQNKLRVYYVQALNDLGFAYLMSKNYTKADENFLARIAAAPETAYSSRYLLAFDYFSRFNKPKEALDVLLPASSSTVDATFKASRDFKIYALAARLYSYFKDYPNAEKYAQLAIDAGGPGNKDNNIQIAHIILANTRARKENMSAAEAEIKIINDLAGSPKAQACAVSSVYVTGKNYAKATTLAGTVAPAQTYNYSICLKTLADASLATGKKADAKKYYGDYIKLGEALPEKNIFVVRGISEAQEALKAL